MVTLWWRSLLRWGKGNTSRRDRDSRGRPRPSYRPGFEQFEDRVVPSASSPSHVSSTAIEFAISAPSIAIVGNTVTFTVTAVDQSNDPVPSYSGKVHFSCTDSKAGLPADTEITGGIGIFIVILRTTGKHKLTAFDAAATISGTTNSITVNAAAATHLAVNGASVDIAGFAFHFTVTALDQYGNPVTNYSGTLQFTSTDGQATKPANSTLTDGVGIFSATLRTAGAQNLTVTDLANSTLTAMLSGINVSPAVATHLALNAPTSATAGSTVILTVTALDQYGNTAKTYTGIAHFTATDSAAVLPGDANLTSGVGIFSTIFKTAGNQTLAVTDPPGSTVVGVFAPLEVSPGAATHFTVTAPSNATTGVTVNFTVTAQDGYGNTATGYTGTVGFSSTDEQALLPANTTLAGGHGNFSATLQTIGNQTLSAIDTLSPAISGATAINVGPVPYTADQRYIRALFQDDLGRLPSTSELTTWVNNLNAAGHSLLAVTTAIDQSAEARTLLIQGWYSTYLGRTAAPTEVQNWLQMLTSGASEERVQILILTSGEFARRANTVGDAVDPNTNYVYALYHVLLNRTPTSAEVSGWLATLQSQGSAAVAQMFLESAEYRTRVVSVDYATLLHRTAAAVEVMGWVNLTADSPQIIRYLFESSEEFYLSA